ncbi:MAG: ABC transporter permease subunit, partial [Pyrinomonadaceae bacterium]|nr:ABC transporter permease subunit [Sphingobacteriaceae bacterium]
MKNQTACLLLLGCLAVSQFSLSQERPIRVGAKHFNEGYILSEMIALILEDAGFKVDRKFNLGGTAVSFEALRNNAIDVYPEYTGTISAEILKQDRNLSADEINKILKAKYKLEISEAYGFSNTYALVIKDAIVKSGDIQNISDLQHHPDIVLGLSYEFLKRKDGWENLSKFYNLPHKPVGLEHGLAYQAIIENKIDGTDAYATDGEIKKYNLIALKDDRNFFPSYQAVSFYQTSFPVRAKTLLSKLTALISEQEMQALNAKALLNKVDHKEIAKSFLIEKRIISSERQQGKDSDLLAILIQTWVHIKLTMVALIAAIIFALPIGILIYKHPLLSKAVLYITGIFQTIPSIALIALMIPFFGIGTLPAMIALFIYAILPILRNTIIGFFIIDPQLIKVASAIGLSSTNRLFYVELPL